jgi:hypothetical protein
VQGDDADPLVQQAIEGFEVLVDQVLASAVAVQHDGVDP